MPLHYLKYLFYHKPRKVRKRWDAIGGVAVAAKAVVAEYALMGVPTLAVDLAKVPAKDTVKVAVKEHVLAVVPVIHIKLYAN